MKSSWKRSWLYSALVGAILSPMFFTAPLRAEPMTIRASIQSPAKSLFSVGYNWLLTEIEKATEGRVKFERYYSGSLAKPNEQLRAVGTGLAGMALVVPAYIPAQLPLANVGTNPALWKDSWTGTKAYSAVYASQPAMKAELDKQGTVLISAYATPTYFIVSRSDDLHSLKQLSGMRVMVTGQIAVLLKSLGAQVVSVSIPEGYEVMQRGTVDGAVYGLTAAVTYGIEGVSKSLWELPVGGQPVLALMNKHVWEKISKKDQEAIRKVAEGHPDAFHKIYQVEGDGKALEKFKKAGVKIIKPDQESLAGLRATAQNIWDQWAKEREAAGQPGKKIMADFVRFSDDFAKKNPYLEK